MRILFITSTRVGDAILSTGLLDRLITTNPGARVTLACGPAAAPLFEAVPGLDRIIVLDKMAMSLHWPLLWAATMGRPWDALVDLRNSPMSYLLPARRRWRLGSARDAGHRVRQLAEVMDLGGDPPSPRLWIGDAHADAARRLIPDGRAGAGPWPHRQLAGQDLARRTLRRTDRPADRARRHPARRPGGGVRPRRTSAPRRSTSSRASPPTAASTWWGGSTCWPPSPA